MIYSYQALVQGREIDVLFSRFLQGWILGSILGLAFWHHDYISLLILMGSYIRAEFDSLVFRLSLSYIMIMVAIIYNWIWLVPLLLHEIMRSILIWLPFMLNRAEIPSFLLKYPLYKAIRLVSKVNRTNNIQQIRRDIEEIIEDNTRLAPNYEEKVRFIFKHFNEAIIIYVESINGYAFILPGVAIHFGQQASLLLDDFTIEESTTECPICYDTQMKRMVELKCGSLDQRHKYCVICFANWSLNPICPLCRLPVG